MNEYDWPKFVVFLAVVLYKWKVISNGYPTLQDVFPTYQWHKFLDSEDSACLRAFAYFRDFVSFVYSQEFSRGWVTYVSPKLWLYMLIYFEML